MASPQITVIALNMRPLTKQPGLSWPPDSVCKKTSTPTESTWTPIRWRLSTEPWTSSIFCTNSPVSSTITIAFRFWSLCWLLLSLSCLIVITCWLCWWARWNVLWDNLQYFANWYNCFFFFVIRVSPVEGRESDLSLLPTVHEQPERVGNGHRMLNGQNGRPSHRLPGSSDYGRNPESGASAAGE